MNNQWRLVEPSAGMRQHAELLLQSAKLKPLVEHLIVHGGRPYLVGGTARDLYLNAPIRDIDIEVFGIEEEQLEQLIGRFFPVNKVGKSFGVFKLAHVLADISLPRTDSAGRHPSVVCDPNMPLDRALIRRDLTMNAFVYDLTDHLFIDPFDGIKDVESRILRAPDTNFFVQDPLRLWRVFQFIGRFNASVDDALTSACASMSLGDVANERIHEEIYKWAARSVNAGAAIEWIIPGKTSIQRPELLCLDDLSHGALTAMLRAMKRTDQLLYLNEHEKVVLRLAVVGSAVRPEHLSAFITRVSGTTQVQRAIRVLLSASYEQDVRLRLQWHARALERVGLSSRALALFWWCLDKMTVDTIVAVQEQLMQRSAWYEPEVPIVQAIDLLHLVAAGPQLGELLDRAYKLQITEQLYSKQELIHRVISGAQ